MADWVKWQWVKCNRVNCPDTDINSLRSKGQLFNQIGFRNRNFKVFNYSQTKFVEIRLVMWYFCEAFCWIEFS